MKQAFGDHGHHEVALGAGLGGEQGLEAEAANGAEHGLDVTMGEVAFDLEGLGGREEGFAGERAANQIDQLCGEMGEVAEGFVFDLRADAEGAAEEVGLIESCPCRFLRLWLHGRGHFLMAYLIIRDCNERSKRKPTRLVATNSRAKQRQPTELPWIRPSKASGTSA